MIYIDTSCLLKLLHHESQSEAVVYAAQDESEVIISSLSELETEVQLRSMELGGVIRTSEWRQCQVKFAAMRNCEPFSYRHLPAAIFQTALRQHRKSGSAYCRSLDGLHLAAMEELHVTRLMTLDLKQAEAATALGFKVLQPGRK